MKSASADLINLLANSKQFVMTEVYTFTLADGTVLVYASGADVAPNAAAVAPGEPQAPVIS